MARCGRWLVFIGLISTMVGLALMIGSAVLLPEKFVWLGILIGGAIAGFGSGITISPNQTFALTEVPVEQGGAAGGVLQTMQRIGSSIGIAGVTLVFFSTCYNDSLAGYTHAFALSMSLVIGLMALGALFGLADALRNDGREELMAMETPEPVEVAEAVEAVAGE